MRGHTKEETAERDVVTTLEVPPVPDAAKLKVYSWEYSGRGRLQACVVLLSKKLSLAAGQAPGVWPF